MKLSTFIVIAVIALTMVGTASAKSLFVITNINANPIPIQAYDIQAGPTYLAYQTTHTIPDRAGGAVGLAIDSDSGYLFATFEVSGTIDLIDGTTMTTVGQVTAPGASNLAGIVVDHDNSRVYTLQRGSNHMYVYDWNSAGPTLTLVGTTYVTLTDAVSAYDLALDEVNDLLYVGDSTNAVKVYNTADWSKAGEVSLAGNEICRGIAIDVSNQLLYCGTGGPSGGTYLLSKVDLATGTGSSLNVGAVVLGVAVDPATGLVYATTYGTGSGVNSDSLLTLDSGLNILKNDLGDLGNPTGLAIPGKDVSYNPLSLDKDDGVQTCVFPGDLIMYTISYSNPGAAVTGVSITDAIPADTIYVSSTGGGAYDGAKVDWNLGSAQTGSVTMTVLVNAGTSATKISNSATIDSDQTPTTTKLEETAICAGIPGVCGDGTVDPGEQCDDGNNNDGDGCSANCTNEGPDIPEFTIIGAGLALLGAGLVAWRKRK